MTISEKKKNKIAIHIPVSSDKKQKQLKLGLLKNKGQFVSVDDFKITDQEFLNS